MASAGIDTGPGRRPVEIRYALPDPHLFDVVAAYLQISITGDQAVEDLLPPDMASIRVSVSGAWMHGEKRDSMQVYTQTATLCGPTSKALWTRGKGVAFCIGLHPLAWAAIFGQRADDMCDAIIPLSDSISPAAKLHFDALSDCETFEERVAAANIWLMANRKASVEPGLATQIMTVRLALADPDCATVEALADRLHISQPSLTRLCKRHFGFSPKPLIRRARFRRMLHRVDARSYDNWRAFIDSQYVDQSHLIRDFQFFLGRSPSQYMALDRPYVAAAFAAFRKMMGEEPV
jgi:AraC-like DNA-binding protein